MKLLINIIGISLVISGLVFADTHYVDKNSPSAADSGIGSEANPWATVQYGVENISGGDR